ncbi:MAG: nucleotidyltransferase domain-containing protein [Natrialbaceae archaeon]|nr:nucleotidyltransferase domain-containing protein [Natrialbaceae archaeon]
MGATPPEDLAARITAVLEEQPVELAVLFGSQVRGTASSASDVDVAVAFTGDRSPSDRLERRIECTVELMEALGTDAVDVADFATLPASCCRVGTRPWSRPHRHRRASRGGAPPHRGRSPG